MRSIRDSELINEHNPIYTRLLSLELSETHFSRDPVPNERTSTRSVRLQPISSILTVISAKIAVNNVLDLQNSGYILDNTLLIRVSISESVLVVELHI